MPNYLFYRDDVETIAPDEQETQNKIIEVMTEGMHKVRRRRRNKTLFASRMRRRLDC